MLLLTGATGTVGRALLRHLTAQRQPVRCLVRDPRRLGAERVRVQIALGDLGDERSFRHALRGVTTVVHLAAAIRDQPSGTIEQLVGDATWNLVHAAERAGARRFVLFSTLAASPGSSARLMRAKAVAERAVTESSLTHTVFAPSVIYSPSDPYLRLLARMSWLPVMPIPGAGDAGFQPIWAEDVAECVLASLPGAEHAGQAAGARYELAGPDTLTQRELVTLVLRSLHRRRRLVGVPMSVTVRLLRALELAAGQRAFATPDEATLMEVPLLSQRGTADAESLGVTPKSMRAVLGVG